ncbi:putative ribosomal large subunit biogenesis-related protein [Cutaneotrichosporon oleaginosum]|uniref:Nucleolar protein 16 n=1 Tax=Cutaneotrichosporon oleaginosum TaxID=879819 RepID=A0A0J0XK74_9TREE|nr:putative ribosomal large subunit biogenesis-related protein [Cutaneotrichosporon oleaginosum]KLT41485.1 putative ribosomal large subunit biogenesis-related protein [Cutaneotrichosporon oleaginosum]TXT05865.1 hypothetical protein COLE_07185 [Cutaneotrichosporon oleaginosum]
MANPRQRSKAKSHKSTKPSLAQKKRMHAKLKKAPPLRGPETLQKAWDKKKTVYQNYAALGLLPTIPIPSKPERNQRVKLPLLPPTEEASAPKIGFGRIVRDDDGNVIDIIIDDDEEDDGKPKPLNAEEKAPEPVVAKTQVVRDLEALAASAAPVQRHTSSQEHVWLAELVRAHDDDYTSMARDRKLNVWQKTPGEIKRMVKKAGGVQALRGMDVDA